MLVNRAKDQGVYASNTITHALSLYVSAGILQRKQFHKGYFSEVSLTLLGHRVVDDIISPLTDWTQDPHAVEEITAIRKRLEVDPDAYIDLYSKIATSYIKTSPNKNADRSRVRDEAIKLLREFPDALTVNDLARQLGVAPITVKKAISPLQQNGEITQRKAQKGNRVFLTLSY